MSTSFKVVGYYTKNSLYTQEAARMKESLLKYSIPHDVEGLEDFGSWYANTNFKPTFLRMMDEKYPDMPIVYVDCDAVFQAYPHLFDIYACDESVKVAVHEFDAARNYGAGRGTEILSGTVYLRHGETRKQLLKAWEERCISCPTTWDQKSLRVVLGRNFTNLPGEYCKIFDRMKYIENPIIVHNQASRKVRNKFIPVTS